MPYFSFILHKNQKSEDIMKYGSFNSKVKYFSKNTKLWSYLKKATKIDNSIHIQKEKRLNAKLISKNILFCLPPALGLGDHVEYALALKAIMHSKHDLNFGVAFVGHYKNIYKKIFKINNVFDYITENEINNFETTFHISLEIPELITQKYDRQNIESLITNFFQVPIYRKKLIKNQNKKKIRTISIFPISNSPLRTLPIYILNLIISNFIEKYNIEIYLDKSDISQYVFENICHKDNLIFHRPTDSELLITKIKNIEFGIFPDSGPLHVAKIYQKKGILLISSVSKRILLNKFDSIKSIESNYKSDYCRGPCGLVNVFQYNQNHGCYDNLLVSKKELLEKKNLSKLQRGDLKKNYLNLYISSINCYKYFDGKKIIKFLSKHLK